MEIPEKIRLMREFLRLSRPEFCEKTGIPMGTLKNIEITGATPRANILAKMLERWPGYAKWVLSDSEYELAPSHVHRVIDVVDCRYMRECVIDPAHFGKVIFVQFTRESEGGVDQVEHKLGALITLPKNIYIVADDLLKSLVAESMSSCIWVKTGNMSFHSDHSGRNALAEFCSYLKNSNPSILEEAKLMTLDEKYSSEISTQLVIREHWMNQSVNSEFQEFLSER